MFVIRRLAILRGGHVAQNALLPLINTVALRGRGQLTWLLTDELTGREERKADRPILPGATKVHGSSPPIENSDRLSPDERALWDRLCAKIAEDLTPEEMDRAAPGR